jgi:hypothetical protein
MSSTLLGLSEASHIVQVDMGGFSPNPADLFCMFSCHHIFLYFQGYFGVLDFFFFESPQLNYRLSESLTEKCVAL